MDKLIKTTCSLLIASGLLWSVSVDAGRWPDIKHPPRSAVQWVAMDMKMNDIPMRIKRFSSRVSAEEVINFYRARWGSRNEKRSVENRVGKWYVIGRRQGKYYLTVQARNTSSTESEGFLAISMLPGFKPKKIKRQTFPRLGGSKVFTDLKSNDAGKKGRTLIIQNNSSVRSNAEFYKTNLTAEGWMQDASFGGYDVNNGSYTLSFMKQKQIANIIIKRNKLGTVVVVNISATGI